MFYKKPEVICIGSTSLDLFFPTDEGVVIETPEDVLAQRKVAFELGGKVLAPDLYDAVGGVAANVSQGLARLGKKVAVYSCIGDDTNGTYCLKTLKEKGVLTSHIRSLSDAKTDVSAIVVVTNANGERVIIHNRDANKRLVIHERDLSAPWIFVSALNGAWEENLEIILDAQEQKGFQIAFNPGQHNLKENPALIQKVVKASSVLFVNKDEATEIVLSAFPESLRESLESEVHLLERLYHLGAKMVTITDGVRGAWAFDGKEYWHVQVPEESNPVETTGAGDAFASGFLGSFLQGETLEMALRSGMTNSQSVIQYYGAERGLLTREELEIMREQHFPQRLAF